MSVEAKSGQITRVDDNIFTDLGFEPGEAEALKAESLRIISTKLAIKTSLISELARWIEEESLTQAKAAEILGITSASVSDVINHKSVEVSIDKLIDLLVRAGKHVQLSVY